MNWFQTYTRIAFQLHAALEAMGEMYLVDTYYGPQEWRTDTPPTDLRVTLSEIESLRDALPTVTASERRRDYLMVHLRALETVCRYLTGEPMTLLETTRHFLDIVPVPVPETVLDENRWMLEEALGGTGTLAERYARFHPQLVIHPQDDKQILSLYQEAIEAARQRTHAILPIPDEEGVDLEIIRDVFYGAANWYLGGGRSRMELNGDRPLTLLRLLLLACHEGYPGHHTESVLKEHFLYNEKGYTEQSLFFNGPSIIISEGIATLAGSMIFSPDDAAAWITSGYQSVGQPLSGVDLPLLMEAFWAVDPDAIGTNVVLQLEEGTPVEAVIAYVLRYSLSSEAEVRGFVTRLQGASLLRKVYQLSYYHGRHLMEPLLQGEHRLEIWRKLLTEQLTPGMLRGWKGAKGQGADGKR